MLLAPAKPAERMSQLLPSVKCSNCNAPVPLTELGEHVCEGKSAAPPSSTQKPNIAQTSSLSSLPQRLQSLVGSNSPPPPSSSPASSQHISIPNNNHTRFPSTTSSTSSGTGSYSSEPRSHASSYTSSGLSIPPVDKPSPSRLRSMSTTSSTSSSAPSRSSPLSGNRDRTDSLPSRSPTSNSSFLPPPVSPFGRERASSNASARGQPHRPPPVQQPGNPYPGMRPPMSPGQIMRPPTSPGPMMRPPVSPGPMARTPMNPHPQSQYLSNPYNQMPRSPATPQPIGNPHSYAPTPPPADVDTKTGGEAGMAGVGRRGFAAVARAAMFVSTAFPPPADQTDFNSRSFHRPNAPGFLDINTSSANRATETPPLSSSSEFSPLSPYPQTPVVNASSGVPARLSPAREPWQSQPTSNSTAPPVSPHLPFFEKMRNQLIGEASSPSKSEDDATTPTKYNPDDDVVTVTRSDSQSSYASNTHRRSESGSSDSGSEIGLAYADSADGEEEESGEDVRPPSPAALRIEKKTGLDEDVRAERRRTRIARFTTASASAYSRSSGGYFSGLPYNFERDSHAGGGNLDRAIEAVLDDVQKPVPPPPASEPAVVMEESVLSIGGSKAQRSNTLPNQNALPDLKQPKLPARSKTETERARDAPSRKTRVCVRCETKITDGRWIKVDGGGILCERCWKNMYLPKCRRCNLPIEKQAVSSSDGQLKGKYHKECFNCHTCQKPFPDKTFYVFDGKPLCAYHYHEANKSLCASPDCGQPIEGPCAVSHSGARFHPEHLLCEYSGYPGCKEKLVEYWEIDGRMLCEKHAQIEDDGEDLMTKANKRMTRFIDLTAYGNDSDSDEGEDLR